MSISIEKELGPAMLPFEECIFCGKGTQYWSTYKDVSVCKLCAYQHEEWDVPSKEVWVKRGSKARNFIQKPNTPPPRAPA